MVNSILILLAFCSLFLLWQAECSVVLIDASNYSLPFYDSEASFAPRIPAIGVVGKLYAAEPLNACVPLEGIKDNDSSGFLLIERGDCNFVTKVRHAQDAGYAAAIVYNDEDSDDLITMSGSGTGIGIYAVFVSKKAGETLYSSIGEIDSRCCLLTTSEDAAKSFAAISFIALLTVFAIFSTLFYVRRHRYRRGNSRAREREARGMAWKDVNSLSVIVYGTGIEESSTTCAVCLEDYRGGERLRILPCGHDFHVPCIDRWLTTQRCFCPICKMDARSRLSQKAPSEQTPLLASCTPNFNTMASVASVGAISEDQQYVPYFPRNWRSDSFSSSQFCQEDLMQSDFCTFERVASSTTPRSWSPPEVSASDTPDVAVLVNFD